MTSKQLTTTPTDTEKKPPWRPYTFKPEYTDLLLAYFQMPAWDSPIKDDDGKVTMATGFFPTLAGFCCQIGTTQPTLRSWANEKLENGEPRNPDFLSAYERVREYQEDYFTKGYMAGKYTNPAVGALIAKNLMNWKDKSEVDQTTVATVTATVTQRVELDFSDMVDAAKGGAA